MKGMFDMSEKSKEEFKERRKAIMSESKHGVYRLSDEELKKCDEFCEDYKKFLAESKIEREFVINAVDLIKEVWNLKQEQRFIRTTEARQLLQQL